MPDVDICTISDAHEGIMIGGRDVGIRWTRRRDLGDLENVILLLAGIKAALIGDNIPTLELPPV